MDEQQAEGHKGETDEVKTCSACGGTWAASRRHCLACGASLADVPSMAVGAATGAQEINWTVLEALSPKGDAGSGLGAARQAAEVQKRLATEKPQPDDQGLLARLLRWLGLGEQ